MNDQLPSFIKHAQSKGMDSATIRMILLSAGWKEKDIAEAISAQSLTMPVPMPQDMGGARDAFVHLLRFVTLVTSFTSLTILFFTYINRLFPDAATDPAYYNNGDLTSIRWSMAALIVSFPLFLWLTKMIAKDMRSNPEKSWSGIRRWLTYFTLFVAACVIVGDVITLVFQILEGELSIRFLLKVFTLLVLAGMTFAYEFMSLRLPPTAKKTRGINMQFQWGSIAITLLALVWGGFLVGTPSSQRDVRFDERRVQDLQMIAGEARNIAYEGSFDGLKQPSKPVPPTLSDLVNQAVYNRPTILDPVTGEMYEYTVLSATNFEICATFSTVRDLSYDIAWNHGKGRVCFTRDVRKL